MSSVLKSPHGVAYRFFLSPEFDTGRHIVVLDLVLQKLGSKKNESNLLDSTGKLHGYQPYIFAASDFANGAEKSVFGGVRTIVLDRPKMKFVIKVKDATVSTTSSSSQAPSFQFDALTLEIIADEATTQTSRKATP